MVISGGGQERSVLMGGLQQNHVLHSRLCAVATDSDPALLLYAGSEHTVVEEGRSGRVFRHRVERQFPSDAQVI